MDRATHGGHSLDLIISHGLPVSLVEISVTPVPDSSSFILEAPPSVSRPPAVLLLHPTADDFAATLSSLSLMELFFLNLQTAICHLFMLLALGSFTPLPRLNAGLPSQGRMLGSSLDPVPPRILIPIMDSALVFCSVPLILL